MEIERNLNKKVSYLCWPGGSATIVGVKIARELGYTMTTAARDIHEFKRKIPNSPEKKIDRIYRVGPGLYWNKVKGKGSIIKYKKGFSFIISLLQFQKRYGFYLFGRIYFKLINVFMCITGF